MIQTHLNNAATLVNTISVMPLGKVKLNFLAILYKIKLSSKNLFKLSTVYDHMIHFHVINTHE